MLFVLSLLLLGNVMATDFSSLPESVKKTVLKHGKESEITEIEEDTDEADALIYVITIEKENATIYLEISAGGTLLSKDEDSDSGDSLTCYY